MTEHMSSENDCSGSDYEILSGTGQLGPYPYHLLKRVDAPTVGIPGPCQRRSQRDNAATHIINDCCMGEEIRDKARTFNTRYVLGPVIGEVRSRMMNSDKTTCGDPHPIRPNCHSIHVLTRHLKAFSYFLGADAVGVCRVPERGKYTDTAAGEPMGDLLPNEIVILKRNDLKTTMASDGEDWIVDATAQRCYLHLTMITEVVASYIRKLGYNADADNLRNFKTLMPALVIEAGLGEASRMGIALNPFFGADFKVSGVLTDMPLELDKPIDFGLQDYCDHCDICARVCPGRALSGGGKEMYNGYEKWIVNAEMCFASAVTKDTGTNCFKCIRTCPWTRPNTTPDDWSKWDGSIETLKAAVDERAMVLRENGFETNDAPRQKWWLTYK